ncbi:MAG: DUF192 domain-containing protein [Chromatiales bacterium]
MPRIAEHRAWLQARCKGLPAMTAVLVLGGWLLLAVHAGQGLPLTEIIIETESGGEHRFMLEVADTEAARRRGLMFRKALPADGGMFFDLGEERDISIWMKDTALSLDVLFVRADGLIVSIAPQTRPMTLTPIPAPQPVRAAIEVNGGTCERLGIRVGDRVRHPIFQRRGAATSGS